MDNEVPTPSTSSIKIEEANELSELNKLVDINVWGQHQEVLEQQALTEIEYLSQKTNDTETTNEIKTTTSQSVNSPNGTLDLNSYLQRQQELKKYQKSKRCSEISEKSRVAAKNISKIQFATFTGRKRSKNLPNSEVIVEKRGKFDEQLKKSSAKQNEDSDSEYFPSDDENEDLDEKLPCVSRKRKTLRVGEKVKDDGDVKSYQERLNQYYKRLEEERKIALGDEPIEHTIKTGFKISAKVWNSLYRYQKKGVKWLLSLHERNTGGLLGDEMGLGKTVQVIAFLLAIHQSKNSTHGFLGLGPSLIVCPSTVLHQWVKHFHEWSPEFRVSVLHQTGSYSGNKLGLIKEVIKCKGILVTTYQSMLKFRGALTQCNWHYIILDEGHKIRNPDAQITVAVKHFRTPHRLLLTGSPMQNNLQELWSLFDFINPGLLGTLPVFMEHFAGPILQGGYANATEMQEALGLSMAKALKEMISPHLLRRTKDEVRDDIFLPGKSEQVLFCSLTPEQKDLYKGFLMSEQVSGILGRGSRNWASENYTRANILMAITNLRKICNHPDIYLSDGDCFAENENEEEETKFGHYKKSGKMVVVAALLKIWIKQKHRTLLFTQGRAMLGIFEQFLQDNNYKYLKMDGTTSISSRQSIIDEFNTNLDYDVFLLTTRVGGLGINLTGADRVIIYDPDWNPATDTQARERAWRIGQEKEVTIYRLLTAGTIEEKMYQRQVWKQLLSNKVLLGATTNRIFKTSDLYDLFSLQENSDSNPETTNIFKNSRINLEERLKKKQSKKAKPEVKFSDEKIEKMKQLAAQISKQIASSSSDQQNAKKLDPDQEELLEKRREKLQQREILLKQLGPAELREYNRQKANFVEEPTNKVDDCDTDIPFTNALVMSEEISGLYKSAKTDRSKVDLAASQYGALKTKFAKPKATEKQSISVDYSGKVEGEVIEQLVRRETKKRNRRDSSEGKSEGNLDDYVLGKLFAKKGVHCALHHDSVVGGNRSGENSLRLHSDTKLRTDEALTAIRKSNFNKWRW